MSLIFSYTQKRAPEIEPPSARHSFFDQGETTHTWEYIILCKAIQSESIDILPYAKQYNQNQ